MKAKKLEHFLEWRKAPNQAGTHKVNRLANSDTPILDKQKYERGDVEFNPMFGCTPEEAERNIKILSVNS